MVHIGGEWQSLWDSRRVCTALISIGSQINQDIHYGTISLQGLLGEQVQFHLEWEHSTTAMDPDNPGRGTVVLGHAEGLEHSRLGCNDPPQDHRTSGQVQSPHYNIRVSQGSHTLQAQLHLLGWDCPTARSQPGSP